MIPKITCIRRTIFFQYGAIYYILPAPLFTFCDFVKVKRNHRRAVMHCHETPHAAQKSFGNLLLKILVILFYKPATTNKQYIRLILGEILSERIAEKLGAKVLVQISQNLQKQLPGLRGFPPTNLKNMKQFHAEYQILIFSQSLTGQLRKRRKSSKTETARLPGIRHPPPPLPGRFFKAPASPYTSASPATSTPPSASPTPAAPTNSRGPAYPHHS